MVKRAPLPFFTFFVCAGLTIVSAVRLVAKDPDYKIGDRADADVVTPIPLVVVDREATDRMKEREAQRVPVIYRFYPRALEETDAAFHSTFATTRSNFLDAFSTAFRPP